MIQNSILVTGLVLIVIYCVLATFADAATRLVAQEFEAPQLFFFSGAVGLTLSFALNRRTHGAGAMRPKAPWLLALRSALFVMSCAFYFYAFRALLFVEVFAFIALVPVIAALLSSPILKESVHPFSWVALLAGTGGMLVMHPSGFSSMSFGHFAALLGAMTGAISMVLARLISRYDSNALLQVFYPNVAICAVMALALPFVYQPMSLNFTLIIVGYGVLLFAARWVLILALAHLPAYVVTPLINLQFVFMLGLGYVAFGEVPSAQIVVGAMIIMTAGAMLVIEQYRRSTRETRSDTEVMVAE